MVEKKDDNREADIKISPENKLILQGLFKALPEILFIFPGIFPSLPKHGIPCILL
jgi:hypothetical protein